MFLRKREPLIFERSVPGMTGMDLPKLDVPEPRDERPAHLRRSGFDAIPSLSEPEVIRHFTRLSLWNYGLDQGLYPLGSCTMKHNPRVNELLAGNPGFAKSHPMAEIGAIQGNLQLLFELQNWLAEITGLPGVTLQPAAGAHGEITGVMIIRAYHLAHGRKRKIILVPDSAHGTNPATAAMAGYETVEVPSGPDGTISFQDLTDAATGKTRRGLLTLLDEYKEEIAGIMVTNPNTLGIFEHRIAEVAQLLHGIGALVYMDGANMNALTGVARPGDFGVDVMHLNLHKTFSTPHGGGGPGAGPVCVTAELTPYLPKPVVEKDGDDYRLNWNCPQSIGRVHGFFGNYGILIRALAYCLSHGSDGLRQATLRAIVNANYLRARLKEAYHIPYEAQTLHEVIFNDVHQAKFGVTTLDIAKRLIDWGYHPPTVYFPLIVHGALMTEPTENESKEELDAYVEALLAIAKEAEENPDLLHQAPLQAPLRRLDETTAARKPVLKWTRS